MEIIDPATFPVLAPSSKAATIYRLSCAYCLHLNLVGSSSFRPVIVGCEIP